MVPWLYVPQQSENQLQTFSKPLSVAVKTTDLSVPVK